MSTRGAVGIRMNSIDKIGYNHFDSYPSGLGNNILIWLAKMDFNKLKNLYNEIEFTDDYEKLTWDWNNHCLNTVFEDQHVFLYDSLFCEYAYIVNLDSGMLEFYVGFNKDPDANGRYAKIFNKDGYCGVKLENEIPLVDLFEGKYEIYEINEKDNYSEGFRKIS